MREARSHRRSLSAQSSNASIGRQKARPRIPPDEAHDVRRREAPARRASCDEGTSEGAGFVQDSARKKTQVERTPGGRSRPARGGPQPGQPEVGVPARGQRSRHPVLGRSIRRGSPPTRRRSSSRRATARRGAWSIRRSDRSAQRARRPAVAAERDVEVVAQPARQARCASAARSRPRWLQREVGRMRKFGIERSTRAGRPGRDRHVRVAREVAVDLEGEGVGRRSDVTTLCQVNTRRLVRSTPCTSGATLSATTAFLKRADQEQREQRARVRPRLPGDPAARSGAAAGTRAPRTIGPATSCGKKPTNSAMSSRSARRRAARPPVHVEACSSASGRCRS